MTLAFEDADSKIVNIIADADVGVEDAANSLPTAWQKLFELGNGLEMFSHSL